MYARLSSFEEDWAGGRVAGWGDRGEGPLAGGAATIIDLEAFEAVEELETLGAPALAPRQLPGPSRSVLTPAWPHAAAQVVTRAAHRSWFICAPPYCTLLRSRSRASAATTTSQLSTFLSLRTARDKDPAHTSDALCSLYFLARANASKVGLPALP